MTAESRSTRTIKTDYLARVEGEGAMHVRIRDGEVEEILLRIYEPPRFFEAFLRGRQFTEPPDITARICGICPVAYQMSACAAVEDACGVSVDEPIRKLRRLIYCGEWIESHTLHVFMLHGPDFLGYESAVSMARDHREIVERGLRIKKAGNELIALLGGREVHPINVRVGGFWRAPGKRELSTGARPRHVEPGPRHRCRPVRGALRRGACAAFDRAALASARARFIPGGADGTLCAER